ncbi:LCP family protein [Cryptosporangium phraense]|uniref:LCP family protein n=1 Tax=Cryptosporangium phraense TaxID=2593070 RepID=UPI00197AFAC4|nr:LCP family protein [Cryptosporangium phraense]
MVSVYGLTRHYENKVKKGDLLGAAAGPRDDTRWDRGPLNLLLLGSDSRATEDDPYSSIGERSDTIMLVHVSRNLDHAYVISVPRDSYVYVPAAGEDWRGGMNKINAAFAFGGSPLTALTLTRLTGVQFDGATIANFASVHKMIDAVGGVNVCLPYEVRSIHTQHVFKKGCQKLDGDQAEDLMRQRYSVPGGDFGRIHDQQLVIKALIQKVTDGGMLTNPFKLDRFLSTVADALTIDENVSLRELAVSLKGLRPANVQYTTVPYTSASLRTSAGAAVQLDTAKSKALFAAIRNDTVGDWIAANPTKVPSN